LAPYNTFISGDGNDKCFIWTIRPKTLDDGSSSKFECIKIGELDGHKETVEFVKFNFDGKLCVTGGMNNVLRIWQVNDNANPL
jgi:WD40 repeat protein